MVLDQRVAIVTGASRGIGRAIALTLAQEGAKVVVNYAGSTAKAQEVVDEINSRFGEGRSIAVQGNVAKAEDVEGLIDETIKAFGRIDILVNNAGITRDTLLMRMKEEDWDAVLDTNLKGVFLCTKGVVKTMMKQRYGRIINIASVVGQSGNGGQANYSAAKAGVIGFTKSMARELASRNITVNAVAPGYIVTDMTEAIPEQAKESLLQSIPLGRLGKPEDIAKMVAFLAGDDADYVTGQTLNVDGGMVMA